MGRSTNSAATERLTLSLSGQQLLYLQALSEAGLHGKNPTEIASQFVMMGIINELQNKTITKLPPVDTASVNSGEDDASSLTPSVKRTELLTLLVRLVKSDALTEAGFEEMVNELNL